jgi:DNA-binding FadR family transcriptional regulator
VRQAGVETGMVAQFISAETRSVAMPRGAVSIAQDLKQAITGKVYGQGAQLPTERQLADSYHASRTTIRKALAMLEAQNLVQRRAGSGTYVSFNSMTRESDIAERTSPLELIEVRAAIEPQIARLAVLHASARDLEVMHGLIRELQTAEQANNSEAYAAADERFHLAMASATSNPLLVWLYRQINETRTHTLWAKMRQKIITQDNMRLYNEQHAAAVRAIQSRDARAAADVMVQHMEKARSDLIGAHSQ